MRRYGSSSPQAEAYRRRQCSFGTRHAQQQPQPRQPITSGEFAACIELLGYLALHERDYPEMMDRVAAARAELARVDQCPECGGDIVKRCPHCDQAGQ